MSKSKSKSKMTKTKVKAHLVDVDWPVKLGNPCNEINLPVLMRPIDITYLRLKGIDVYDYTESLKMEDEFVDPESCYSLNKL
jgi:hypothetical protein